MIITIMKYVKDPVASSIAIVIYHASRMEIVVMISRTSVTLVSTAIEKSSGIIIILRIIILRRKFILRYLLV